MLTKAFIVTNNKRWQMEIINVDIFKTGCKLCSEDFCSLLVREWAKFIPKHLLNKCLASY